MPEDKSVFVSKQNLWPRRVRFALLYGLYLAVLSLVGLSLYSFLAFDVPVTRTVTSDDVWRVYYPELWTSKALPVEEPMTDATLDVLLLGGSVLQQMTEPLAAALQHSCRRTVRIYNVSVSAHTTRDSWLKYQRLSERPFDLILIYHGINDARMNCVSRQDYRDDYSHCGWYFSVEQRLKAGAMSVTGLSAAIHQGKIPNGPLEASERRLGRTIKTEAAFRLNVGSILNEAKAKQTPVLLMTFATYLAPDYSAERFLSDSLDYGDGVHKTPAEVWGEPDAVIATVQAHNQVVRELATGRRDVLFVDLAEQMPQSGQNFSDICHLTDAGCERFVASVMSELSVRFLKP